MIAPTEKDWVLLGLDDFHASMLKFGINLDQIQKNVSSSMPQFNIINGVVTILISMLFWVIIFNWLHLFIVKPFMLTKAT